VVVATSVADLAAKLAGQGDGVYLGSADPRRAKKAGKSREAFNAMYAARDLERLAEHWTMGAEIDWERLHGGEAPVRVSLPTYPFAKDRHWIGDHAAGVRAQPVASAPAALHPLISYNSSTLAEVTFSSWLADDQFYAQDHRVNGQPMFPGSGYLEMACMAGALAGGRKVARLTDVVWVAPLVFDTSPQLVQIALQTSQDSVEYMVTSFADGDDKLLHSEGIIHFADDAQAPAERVALGELQAQCTRHLDPGHYYDLFEQSGISYGPAFRTMQQLSVAPTHALSRLVLADHLRAGFDEFVLHPSMIDGALQTVAALVGQGESASPFLPFAIDAVEIIRPLAPVCHVLVEHADASPHGSADIMRFNIRIVDGAGHLLVNIRNFCVRALAPNTDSVAPAARKAVK
jgi:polyketide synthase PksL